MEYRSLSNSDLKLSAITFGAWAAGGWMWGKTDRNEAIEAIRASYLEGVTSIDTAPIYGQGESEEIVGEAIKEFQRDKIQILTKFGMRWDLAKGDFAMKSKNNNYEDIDVYKYTGKESVIEECENSLRRLKTDYIDLYQIHWNDSTTPIEESFEAVATLVKQGKVRYAGVCNYNVKQMQEAEKKVNIISNQVPYSMITRDIEKDTLPYCIQNKTSVLAYSPMARGLLTGKIAPGHVFAEGDHRSNVKYYTEENILKTNAFLTKIKPLAEQKNITLSQLVLRWTIDQPGITAALAGARNAEQSVLNARAASVQLSKQDLTFINSHLAQL